MSYDPPADNWTADYAAGFDHARRLAQPAVDPQGSPTFNLADPDPDRTFLGLLHRELMTATAAEKETRAALQEHQAKADHLTRERGAIERAIRAYQGGAE